MVSLRISITWIVVETYNSILNGCVYLLGQYNNKIFIELASAVVITVVTYLCSFTNNTYITYFVGWMVGYVLVIYLEDKSVIKNLLSKA